MEKDNETKDLEELDIKNDNEEAATKEETLQEDSENVEEQTEESSNQEENTIVDDINNMMDEEYEEIPSIIVDTPMSEEDDTQQKLRDLDLKLQTLEIKIDEIEFTNVDIEKLPDDKLEEYIILKDQYKALLKEKKEIQKNKKDALGENSIEQSSPWIFLYGFIIDIVNFPFLAYIIYLNFGSWVISKFSKLSSIELVGFFPNLLMWLIVFLLPILLIVLSWLLYNNLVKKKIDKKIFAIFGIIQILFTLATVIWLTIVLFF